MKAFYYDPLSKNWILKHKTGGFEKIPSGVCTMSITGDETTVYIYQGNIRKGMAKIAELEKDSAGNKYADYSDFNTSTSAFINNNETFNTEEF